MASSPFPTACWTVLDPGGFMGAKSPLLACTINPGSVQYIHHRLINVSLPLPLTLGMLKKAVMSFGFFSESTCQHMSPGCI